MDITESVSSLQASQYMRKIALQVRKENDKISCNEVK